MEEKMIQNEKQLDYYEHRVEDYEKSGVLQRTTNRAFKRKFKIIANTIGKSKLGSILEVGAGSVLLKYFAVKDLSFDRYVIQDIKQAVIDMGRKRVQAKANSFTPPGKIILTPVFDFVDWVSPKAPIWIKLNALRKFTLIKL